MSRVSSPSNHQRKSPSGFREAYIPDGVSDSLALASYLKLRQEQRSPHPQNGNGRQLFEDYHFDENASAEEDFFPEADSDRALAFADNLENLSELDYKAMRLLVHTSVHEKEVAQSKVSGLENEIYRLKDLTIRYTSPSTWKLPVTIVKLNTARVAGRKAKMFHVWKEKALRHKLAAVFSESQRYMLKVARKNILKARQNHICRAFQKWLLQVRHLNDTIMGFEKKTALRHNFYRLKTAFKFMRTRRVQRQTLRHMNRILRAVQFRSCFSHWRRLTCGYYRTRLLQFHHVSTVSGLVQARLQTRRQVQRAFHLWAAGARDQRHRLSLTSLTRRCFNNLIRKYANPVSYAFGHWRRVATVLHAKLQAALTLWTDGVHKTRRHALRLAVRKWKGHCVRFNFVTKRIAAYLSGRCQLNLRDAFNRLAAAQTAHLRSTLRERTNRWVRRFFQSVDRANELTVRNVLAVRFWHWHHATHAERTTTRFRGELEDMHAVLIRTRSDLQQEIAMKRAAEEAARHREAHLHSRLVSSRFRMLSKIVGSMLHRQTAKAFRSWTLFTRYRAHQEELAARQLQHHRQRVQATVQRWAAFTGTANLSSAFCRWKTTVDQMVHCDDMAHRRERRVSQRVLQGWQQLVHDNQLQRRCIKRMMRRKHLAVVGLAWERWTRKVARIRLTCKTFVKHLLGRRRNCIYQSFHRWRHVTKSQALYEERVARSQLEDSERHLTLRLHWSRLLLGLDLHHRAKRQSVQLVIDKILNRVRDGFHRWNRFADRQTKLRSVCLRMMRRYAHSLNKMHFLYFARWKAIVWDYQKIQYQDVQEQLADAHARIVNITEQQLVLESHSEKLHAHNERADRIARTLYHQVHRMLSSRRLYGAVRLVFDTWKQHHEFIKRCKHRLRQYFLRSHATAAMLEKGAAFRTWVVAMEALRREEREDDLTEQHARKLMLHKYFALWQTYRTVRRMKMMSVIVRLRTGLQAGKQKSLASAFALWKSETEHYRDYRATTLTYCFAKWLDEVSDIKKKKAVIFRLFPMLKTANIKNYFTKWKENTRKLRLLCDTIVRMLEVTHHNQTYVSTARLRACWSRWAHIMHVNRNQMKACRMVVQCYRKILRTALYTWRRQSDYHHTTLQVRRLAMANLLQMARMHCWNRFYVWKSAVQQMRSVEEHVDKLGLVLKRLRVIRRKRRAWGAWKTLFAKLNSPVASTGVTLRVCGPKYINAITRAQYWSSTLMRSVLVNTTLEPVLALALEALHSVLPEYAPSLYYLEQDQEYLWGHSLPVQAQHRGSASPTALDSMASSLRKLQLSRRYSPVPHDAHPEGTRQYFPVTLSDEQTPFRMRSPVFSQPGMSSHRTPFSPAQTSARMSPAFTSVGQPAGATVLLGEGLVGRCAQQRGVQVFRQGRVSDGTHTQTRTYCSMNIPVPEHSFNVNVNVASSECKDPVVTAVLPLVWGPNVVAVAQFSAPNVDPLGPFYDLDGSGILPGPSASLEQRDKAIKHMSAVVRDLLDFSEINADHEFAMSFASTAASQQSQTVLGRSRTLRGQMMYQLLQLCIELRLDEEKSVALIALLSTIAEIFGRHFPARTPAAAPRTADELATPAGSARDYLTRTTSSAHTLLAASPRREELAIPQEVDLNGSFVGLASYFNHSSEELKHVSTMHQSLAEQNHNLTVIVERLKKSRAKYLERSEQLQRDLSASQGSLEAERAAVKQLSHAIKKAEAKLKSFEQQQVEITRLNNIMRTAAGMALNK